MPRRPDKPICEALSITTVERCGHPALPGRRYCGTHQRQHEAGTLMDPETMRAKYAAVIEGLRARRPRTELMAELGLTANVITMWASKSGVAAELKRVRAEAEAREEEARRERAQQYAKENAEATEVADTVAGLIRSVRHDYRTPQPFLGEGAPIFMFQPAELLELLVELLRPTFSSRLMPLGIALNFVLGRDVVMLYSSDADGKAFPFEWGHLTEAEYGPDHAAFVFDDGWGFAEHDLVNVAVVTRDGLAIPYKDSADCLVVAIAEPADDALHFELTGAMELELDREEFVAIATGPKPERHEIDDDEDADGESPADEDAPAH